MPLNNIDNAHETTTTTGTGPFTVLGAVAGCQSLAAVGNGNTFYGKISDSGGGANWLVGLFTYSTTGPTATVTTIYSSSNGGSAVTFGVGTKDVICSLPAEVVTPFAPSLLVSESLLFGGF